MRLFEVANGFVDDLETLLRNYIGKSDAKHASQKLTWPALSNMLRNFGYGDIDYAGFDAVYQQNPALQALIRNYNEDGIELGTKVEPNQDETDPNQQPVEIPQGRSVDQMAHHAVNTKSDLS